MEVLVLQMHLCILFEHVSAQSQITLKIHQFESFPLCDCPVWKGVP